MRSHEIPWDSRTFHWIPWGSMEFYNVPVNQSVPTETNRGLTSYISVQKLENPRVTACYTGNVTTKVLYHCS
jgi:hypothetical protein